MSPWQRKSGMSKGQTRQQQHDLQACFQALDVEDKQYLETSIVKDFFEVQLTSGRELPLSMDPLKQLPAQMAGMETSVSVLHRHLSTLTRVALPDFEHVALLAWPHLLNAQDSGALLQQHLQVLQPESNSMSSSIEVLMSTHI